MLSNNNLDFVDLDFLDFVDYTFADFKNCKK